MLRPPVVPPIPGPQGPALLRQIPAITRDPLSFLLQAARQYGDLAQFPIGYLMVYSLAHPDLARHVLQDNHRNYTKDTIQYNQLATITGRGLLTADGDHWLRQRRLAQPAFHRTRLEALIPTITAAVEAMLTGWETHARRGEAIDIDEEMMRLALEIVGKALFSIDLSREAQKLTQAVLTALDHIVYKASHFLALPDSFPTPRNRRFRAALATLDAAVAELIESRRGMSSPPDDLLSMLLFARNEDGSPAMTARQVRDEVLTILIAGHETVASALTWAWHLLSLHPEAARRLRQEACAVLGDGAPAPAHLEQLVYTRQVFEETLRLYPPAWLITRRAIGPDRLGEHTIPAGSLLILSPYVIHRNPAWWTNPEGFDPQRFAPQGGDQIPRFAYIPFGGGPRLCIGDRFAALEAQLILAMVARRFRLDLTPGQRVEVVPLVTLRPRHGILMNLQPHPNEEREKAPAD